MKKNLISDFSKAMAIRDLRKELENFRPPREIDERIFYWFCENKTSEFIIKVIQSEFNTKECFARKCWWYSTAQAQFRIKAKRIGMEMNCLDCSEDCVPERFMGLAQNNF